MTQNIKGQLSSKRRELKPNDTAFVIPEEWNSQTIHPIRAQLQNTETNTPCNVALLAKPVFPKTFKKLLTLDRTRIIYSRLHKSLLLVPTLGQLERVHAVL